MKIQVQVKNVYGNPTVYPICDKAKIFAELLNQKTFTHRDLSKIESLGYVIENVPEKFSFAR